MMDVKDMEDLEKLREKEFAKKAERIKNIISLLRKHAFVLAMISAAFMFFHVRSDYNNYSGSQLVMAEVINVEGADDKNINVTYRYDISDKEYESDKVQPTEKIKKGDKKEIRIKKDSPEVILKYNDVNLVIFYDVMIGLCLELAILCLYEMATCTLSAVEEVKAESVGFTTKPGVTFASIVEENKKKNEKNKSRKETLNHPAEILCRFFFTRKISHINFINIKIKKKGIKKMDKSYKPSERQKKCKNAFPYMGKEMNKTCCRKLMRERRDAGEDDMSVYVSNEQCENCSDYESRYIEYPIQVNSIKCDKMKQLMMGHAGSLVKIRPCNKEYGGKTYLGLYLGNQPWSQTVSYNNESGELTVGMATNPAIYVFDLQRIIFGAESWWGIIESLEELKDITDDDINNIWYVKALKAMHKDEPEETIEE